MLNVLPWRQEKINKEKYQLGVSLLLCILITLISAFTVRNRYSQLIHKTNQAIAALTPSLQKTHKRIQYLENQLQNNKTFESGILNNNKTLPLASILQAVVKLIPMNNYLNLIALESNGLVLEGISLSAGNVEVGEFMKRLANALNLTVRLVDVKSLIQGTAYTLHIKTGAKN